MNNLDHTLQRIWYQQQVKLWPLWPMAKIFEMIVELRRKLFSKSILRKYSFDVPVVIIGNITVGGTGKTPLVIALANELKQRGFKPGIVSRGYGSRARGICLVDVNSNPRQVGDEPVLLARSTSCPVVIGQKRPKAVDFLLHNFQDINVVLCDDGLQHYALERKIEIAVIDGVLRFGNGHCLPLGPLRERISRLNKVDFRVINGGVSQDGEHAMVLHLSDPYQLAFPKKYKNLTDFKGQQVHAVAGISNPDRFFKALTAKGISVIPHAFPDHHDFQAHDLYFVERVPIFMTQKDAVKCKRFANGQHWVVPVDVEMADGFYEDFIKVLEEA